MGLQQLQYFAKGCFLEGTPIRTPNGIKRVEDFKPGDKVISFNEDTKELEVSEVEYLDVIAARRYYSINYRVNATGEHPFYTKDGIKKVSELREGDVLITKDGEEVISNIRVFDRDVVVYNLINVVPNHNYYAADFLVHNKGCFPSYIHVSTPNGVKYIGHLREGDEVISFNEKTKQQEVSKIGRIDAFLEKDIYEINRSIEATPTHPFYTQDGIKMVQDLKINDELTNEKGDQVPIISIEYNEALRTVYNLIDVVPNNNYFVEGFLVHNKGGGGCFLADTEILVNEKLLGQANKKIQDLKPGDKIVSFNEETGKRESSTLERVEKLVAENYYVINNYVRATGEHPFYTTDGIKNVEELRIGDTLVTRYGEEKIYMLEYVEDDVVIYNIINVEPNHNYYANYFLVHNKGSVGGRSSSSGSKSSGTSSSKPSAPKPGVSTAKPGSTVKTANGTTVQSSAKKPSQQGYSTSKGIVGDNGYSPRFTNGYSAPPGSVVYYRDTSVIDYLPWIYLFGHSNAAPANQQATVVQPDGKEVVAKPQPGGTDGLAILNWILLILIVAGIIGCIVWGVNKLTKKKKPTPRSAYGW